ncbi:MAG TPA: Flp family type IVb pilin [Xanthobacteraceae bacterium]|jgi:pilus assembly protein Flp/PilA|nr:Flp family type IVb pilin [Xanthobacteraceae bacterium]
MLRIQNHAIFVTVSRFLRDDTGATAIEYAMIASGIGVAIAATVTSLGSGVNGLFTTVSTALK